MTPGTNWRPAAGVATARARAAMLHRARDYFSEQKVLEVSTPALNERTATDPNIESVRVSLRGGRAYLHTSPEHLMKRLLAADYPDIYQICPVYRDGESGARHLPEFTMIEWYRLGFGFGDIIADAVGLAMRLFATRTPAEARIMNYAEAFRAALHSDPLTTAVDQLADALDADGALRTSLADDRDAWLDLAMATRVAAEFPRDCLTVVTHYPASQASLARLDPADTRLAERFELYCGPLELANGFVELTDADEQRRRFEADRAKRAARGQRVPELDEALLEALHTGLPPCAGVALGLDRVLMLDEGHADIRNVVTFSPGRIDER